MTHVQTGLGRRSVVVVVLAFLVGISLTAEFRSYARPDTGFLLDAAARVLDGERLYVDVVEINPPLIVALNMAAVLSARALDISEILLYRLGVTAVLLGLLWLAGRLLRDLLPGEDRFRWLLLLLLAFVLFPMAGQDYGEREHLVLALVIPYLLLAAMRSLGREVTRGRAAGLGLLAGLAFALKPHFLLVWLVVEGYLRGSRRVTPASPLPETLGTASVLAVYGVALLALTPQYLDMARLLVGPYSRFLYDPFLHALVTGPGAVLALFALLAFLALGPRARHPDLWRAIALGTGACLVAGAAQQKGLRYHFYPSFALATVLLGLSAWDTAGPLGSGVRRIYRLLAVGVLSATVIVVCVQNLAAAGGAGDADRERFEEMVRLVRERARGERVYVMSYHLRSAYPLINYSGASSASRFPHLWILAAEYREALGSEEPLRYHEQREMSPVERYLNRAVLEDLSRRPRLLIVWQNARDLPVNGYRRLDYIRYFSRDPAIARILEEYELVARPGDYLVYERMPPGSQRLGPPPRTETGTRDVVLVQEGGARLRFRDPTFLIAVLAFFGGLITAALVERRGPAM